MPRGFESHRLRQKQHLAGCCLLFLWQTMQGLQGGIRTARARRFASRRAATVLRTVARARENPTVCAKYHYSILHWVVIFCCRFAKFRCFLIGISPLFSSSDFSGSVQIIPAIAANSYSQNYTRFFQQLGYKLTAKRRHLISQVPPLFKLPLLYGLCIWQRQRVCHRPGAQVLGLRIQMRVNVGRGGNIAVTQPLLNLLHRYALVQQ